MGQTILLQNDLYIYLIYCSRHCELSLSVLHMYYTDVFAYGSYIIILLHAYQLHRGGCVSVARALNWIRRVFWVIRRTGVGNTIYVKCFSGRHMTHTHTHISTHRTFDKRTLIKDVDIYYLGGFFYTVTTPKRRARGSWGGPDGFGVTYTYNGLHKHGRPGY